MESDNNQIRNLEQRVRSEERSKVELNQQKQEIQKLHEQTEAEKLELQKQNEAKDSTINDLNGQLQAKLEAKRQSLLARAEAAVFPTASAARPAFSYSGGPLSAAQINFLGNCESGNNPATNTGNGFYGAYQFTIPTWNAMGTGYARADMAPLDVQTAAVQKLLSGSSIWSQFPGCASKMSAAGLL